MSQSAPTTRFKKALETAQNGGLPAIGQWLTFPGFTLARTVAALGVDWVLVDCEHGNIEDDAMVLAIAAVTTSGSSPIVRIPGKETWMIKRALDAGAHGVMIPMVETKDQAEAVALASRYRSASNPLNVRGCGGFFAPPNFGLNPVEYHNNANDLVKVIVQIESEAGVQNVDEIAAVPGIDGLFVGPFDLACSLGVVPFEYAKSKEVQDASDRVLAAAKKHGKAAGFFCMGADDVVARARMGWDFMNCGADLVALTSWTTTQVAKARADLGK